MPARFTNLRPAEAKPIDRLRALHTPLYADDEDSDFRDSLVAAGLPKGIAIAAARIADPAFAPRAEHALRGNPVPGSYLWPPSLVALARLLAQTKPETLADEVRRGELSADLAEHIAAASKPPPVRGDDPGSTTSTARGPATATMASDDLLSLYLLPGAFPDYRKFLTSWLKIKRVAARSKQDLSRLLPRPKVVGQTRQRPWPNIEPPIEWAQLVSGRILVPAQIGYNPTTGPGARGRQAAPTAALAKSGLSPADLRRIEAIVRSDEAAPEGPTASKAAAPDRPVAGKAGGRDQKSSS